MSQKEIALLPTDLPVSPELLSQELLQGAFIYFNQAVREVTGMERVWGPKEILQCGEILLRKFANRLGPDGLIRITQSELKRALKEVIGEIFPAHVAMLMKALLETGVANFKFESMGVAGDVEVQVIKEEEKPGEVPAEDEVAPAFTMELKTAYWLLSRVGRPRGGGRYV